LSESGFPGFEDFQDGNLDVVCEDCLNQDFQDGNLDVVCEDCLNQDFQDLRIFRIDYYKYPED
jgi:hypothetical protein